MLRARLPARTGNERLVSLSPQRFALDSTVQPFTRPRAPNATPPNGTAYPAQPFALETVAELARKLAARPYEGPKERVPDWLLQITYDQWRDIRFRPEKALWAGGPSPFQVQFFHPGLFYDRPVAVNVVTNEGAKRVPFSPRQISQGLVSTARA